MHMIGHEDVRMDRHTMRFGGIRESAMKEDAIALAAKDGLLVRPPHDDVEGVVDDSKPERSRHEPITRPSPIRLQRLINWGTTPIIFLVFLLLTSCTVLDPHNVFGRQLDEAK